MKIANPTGKLGEDVACEWLSKKGYKIVDRNFRKGYGEIDIVAIDYSENEPILSFIEVKTRTSSQFGIPIESITYWKLQNLVKTAEFYKHMHKGLPEGMRIDAVSVVLTKENAVVTIDLMKNVSG